MNKQLSMDFWGEELDGVDLSNMPMALPDKSLPQELNWSEGVDASGPGEQRLKEWVNTISVDKAKAIVFDCISVLMFYTYVRFDEDKEEPCWDNGGKLGQ